MKQLIINIPSKCGDCVFRRYVSGFSNNGPDWPDQYECVASSDRVIAKEGSIVTSPESFNTITHTYTKEKRSFGFISPENPNQIWDEQAPDWCPGVDTNFKEGLGITIKGGAINDY